jgi:hypothetical protein
MPAVFTGKGSVSRPEPKRACKSCRESGHVAYTGSEVLHGSPYSPTADTEVAHHYRCERCGHEWGHYV